MANVKISDLTTASAVADANQFEINEGGTSKKVTGAQLNTFVRGSSGTIKTDEIQHSGGTSGLTIDSSGRVSRSLIPSWRVGLDTDQNETTASTYITVEYDLTDIENCFVSGGCTISNGVITVPVAGLYHINATVRFDSVASTSQVAVKILKNNVDTGSSEMVALDADHASTFHSIAVSDLQECAANDTLQVKGYAADTSWHFASNACFFSGYMVG